MRTNAILWTMAAAIGLLNFGCDARSARENVAPPKVLESPAPVTPFRIIATDAGFDAPNSVAAGLRHVVFENRGSVVHEAMLVKLPENKSPADYVEAVKGGSLFPEGALDYSGPGLTSPGETVELWLRVDAGQYIIICWNNGHATSTPVHAFKVEKGIVDDAAPKAADVVLRLFDYRFDVEGTFKKGVQVIRVETPGPSMHEADIFRLHDGKTVADLDRWYKTSRGAPPAEALGGPLDSHDVRRVVWLRRTFAPGRYVLQCALPVRTALSAGHTDKTHADVGMVREIEIAE